MKTQLILLSLLTWGLVGCTSLDEPNSELSNDAIEEPAQEDADAFQPELKVMAEDLRIPWSLEKHGDTFYLTEREGTIVKIENDNIERQAVQLAEELSTAQEAGLLGFVLAPNFAEENKAYAYYTYQGESGPVNRIVVLQLHEDYWQEKQVLVDNIPSGAYHHGGRLKIGPDDKLYATTGDATVPESAQALDSLAGKILRLNRDGSIPDDNPFSNSYVYSYGHRNAQGIVWTSAGTMYASEHGNRANDEINRIEPGKNYGWPVIEGQAEQADMVTPLFTSGPALTWAPSGMATDNERLYVAGLRGNAVHVFDLGSNEYTATLTDYGRIRDVLIADDYLYFITNNHDGRGAPSATDDLFYRIGLSELEQ